MKIRRISRIKSHRIFKDFVWPSELPEFGSFNLIYGWNGAGKTTLSNLFRYLQLKQSTSSEDGEIRFDINGDIVKGADVSSATLPQVRVFNRQSVGRNVFEVPNHQLPPIYFLGEDSVEKEKRIAVLKERLGRVEGLQSQWNHNKLSSESGLERFCTDRVRGIKNLLTTPGGGPYNNYDARLFKQVVQRLLAKNQPQTRLSGTEREKHLATKQGAPMDKVQVIAARFPDFVDITSSVQAILGRTVLSTALPELVEDPSIASWVERGLALHTDEHESDTCRFCSQAIPEGRISQLESHFDDQYKQFQMEIDELINKVKDANNIVSSLRIPRKEQLYPFLREEFKNSVARFSQQSGLTSMYFETLRKALEVKKTEPFKEVDLLPFFSGKDDSDERSGKLETVFQVIVGATATIGATLGKDAFNRINSIIEGHNQHTDNYGKEVDTARRALEEDAVIEALDEYSEKQVEIDYAQHRLVKASSMSEKIRSQITSLDLAIQQHQKPADELKNEMASYLGRDELRFDIQQTGYTITRNGQPAMHLSEGERTAIAFMYFLKTIKDSGFDMSKGIVVIDDPVSSLDANSLYSAFGFMKERTKEAHQLFVLTHNFSFFRQVRNWFQKRPSRERRQRPAQLYMLTTKYISDDRTASLEELDPLLKDYESEYHYLFKCVLEEAERPVIQGTLKTYYSVPNIARRLLEAFLAFRFPNGAGQLYHKLDLVPFDAAKKARILRFLHTHSHFDQIGDTRHDLSALSETPAILQDLIDLIRETDPGHFAGMMAVLQPQDAQ